MSKGSGTTRSIGPSGKRGGTINPLTDPRSTSFRPDAFVDEIVKAAGIDEGDVMWEDVRNIPVSNIEAAISSLTDYEFNGFEGANNARITLIDKYGDSKEDIDNYGTDLGTMDVRGMSLGNVILQLRSLRKSDLWKRK